MWEERLEWLVGVIAFAQFAAEQLSTDIDYKERFDKNLPWFQKLEEKFNTSSAFREELCEVLERYVRE